MSQPLQHGYPDWGRYSARATQLFFHDTITANPSGAAPTWVFPFVGGVPWLGIEVSNNPDAYVFCGVSFWSDRTFTTKVGEFDLNIVQDGFASWAFPTRGPFVAILLQTAVVATDVQLKVFEATAPGPVDLNIRGDAILIRSVSGANTITAGSSKVETANKTWPSRALLHINVDDEGTPWRAVLSQLVGLSGLARPFLEVGDTCSKWVSQEVLLPSEPVQLEIFNDDTASHTFTYSLFGDLKW